MRHHLPTSERLGRRPQPTSARSPHQRTLGKREPEGKGTASAGDLTQEQMQHAIDPSACAEAFGPCIAALAGTGEPTSQSAEASPRQAVQRKEKPQATQTGLPPSLQGAVESLSGLALGDVRVHHNSAKPAPLYAAAYTQGSEIHLGPGQERHLAHEAWHVVQQRQGRVQATKQLKGVSINDQAGLEAEADLMGSRALQLAQSPGRASDRGRDDALAPQQKTSALAPRVAVPAQPSPAPSTAVAQCMTVFAGASMKDADFVERTSLHLAMSIAGGPLATLEEADFSKVRKDEDIVLVGHGKPGQIGAYTAQQILEKLTALREFPHAILITSCHSADGNPQPDDIATSVAGVINAGLSMRGWKEAQVFGTIGPSIKHQTASKGVHSIDESVTVTIPQEKGPSDTRPLASHIQSYLKQTEEVQASVDKLVAQMQATNRQEVEINAAVSEMTAPFYAKLLADLTRPDQSALYRFLKSIESEHGKDNLQPMPKAIIAAVEKNGSKSLLIENAWRKA